MAAIVLALAAAPTALAAPAAAETSQVLACSFATYAPIARASTWSVGVRNGTAGASTQWKISLQRHRGGTWWQNEAVNYHTGDNWASVGAGCAWGTWTYRTIPASSAGTTINANKAITC